MGEEGQKLFEFAGRQLWTTLSTKIVEVKPPRSKFGTKVPMGAYAKKSTSLRAVEYLVHNVIRPQED